MKFRVTSLSLIVIAVCSAGPRGVAQDAAVAPSSEISLMSGSASGWLPSANQRQEAVMVVDDYLSSLDAGQFERAYAMMTKQNQSLASLPQFSQHNQDFNAHSGSFKLGRILKVTWGKDPPSASLPGVYAAIDVARSYANVDRYCGYVILYQGAPDDRFEVMRQESNFIPNAMADQIVREKSRTALDEIWTRLAVHCPNYKPS